MIVTHVPSLLRLGCAIVFLSGCTPNSTFHIKHPLGKSGSTILTTADLRGMNVTELDPSTVPGQVRPKQITCLEPSADLAKAISSNTSGAGSAPLGALFGAGVSGETAASVARSVSESAAQMTDRLASIQLLRDALYRACEAYANGALTATSYAVLLSRYDDVMITMLLGELAAANFGGATASLGGGTSGSANATFQQQRAQAEAEETDAVAAKTEADKKVAAQEQKVAKAEAEHAAAQDARDNLGDAPEADTQPSVEDLDRAVDETQEALHQEEVALAQLQTEQNLLDGALTEARAAVAASRAFASATGISGAKEVSGTERTKIAESLQEMQRKYVENINSDALVVACISALDKPKQPQGHHTLLVDFCSRELSGGGLLAKTLQAQGELLRILRDKSLHEADVRRLEFHAEQMRDIKEHVKDLEQ